MMKTTTSLVAALARCYPAPGKLLLQFLQAVAQPLLVLLQVAHALVATLLAALTILPRILALLEGLVAQLLLLADHVAKLVERLLHFAVALARLRHLQVLQHLLQLVEQLLGGFLVSRARQTLHPFDQADRRTAVGIHEKKDVALCGTDIRIEVTDGGNPAGPGCGPGFMPGHGIVGMRERVAAFGGSLTAGPLPGGGFRVVAEVPAGAAT